MATVKADSVQSPSLASPSVTVDPSTGNVTFPTGSGPGSIAGITITATAAGTTALLASSTDQQEFTGTTTQIVTMPVVTGLLLGRNFPIANKSTGIVTVNSSGGNLIYAIPAGVTVILRCVLITGTTAASWIFDIAGFSTPAFASAYIPKTGAYTFVAGDEFQLFSMNNAATAQFNIPTDATYNFAIGAEFNVFWITGAGQPTIGAVTPGTTTVASNAATSATPKLRVALSAATIKKIAANSWVVFGDIA